MVESREEKQPLTPQDTPTTHPIFRTSDHLKKSQSSLNQKYNLSVAKLFGFIFVQIGEYARAT